MSMVHVMDLVLLYLHSNEQPELGLENDHLNENKELPLFCDFCGTVKLHILQYFQVLEATKQL